MSENAPSLAIADRYKDGRPRRGRAEVQTDVPLTPIDLEAVANEHPTAGQFVDVLTSLQKLREANPHTTFDAENFLVNPEEGSDDAVYAKVLERVHGTTEPLLPHEIHVLAHMQREALLEQAAARVGKDVVEDPKEFYGAAKQALMTMQESLKTPQGDDETQARLNQIHAVMQAMNEPQSKEAQDKSLLALYFEAAEAQNNTPSDENAAALAEAEKALISDETRINNRAFTYGLIAGDTTSETQPTGDKPADPAPTTPEEQQPQVSEQLAALRERQAAETSRLAELMAKRQKRVMGLDFGGRGGGLKEGTQYEQLNALRMHANQELIAQEIREGLMPDGNINLYIARRTVELCKEYDEEIRQNYMKNDGLVGKAINYLTGRNPDGTPVSGWKKVRRYTAQGLLIAGVMTASAVTGGAALAAASGVATGLRVYAQGQKIVRDKRVKRTGGLLTEEEVLKQINAVSKKGFAWQKDDKGELVLDQDGAAIPVEYDGGDNYLDALLEESAAIEQKAVEKDTRKWKLGNFATVAAGVAAGVFAGTVLHGAFGDHASATPGGHEALGGADPSSHVAQAPLSPDALHNMYTGPSSINVNPGDGYFKVFEQMNIPQDQWNSVLGKVSNSLVQHGDAYWMPDGTAGISAPGQMSQFAFDAIKQAANLR